MYVSAIDKLGKGGIRPVEGRLVTKGVWTDSVNVLWWAIKYSLIVL